MTKKTATLFLPEEHLIISSWLRVKPLSELPGDLTLDGALDALGLNEDPNLHTTEEYAVAAILLERIQERLPQWSCSFDDQITLGRNYRERSAERIVELTPQLLMEINWADSGPGCSWPEAYHLIYVPLFEEFVVTGSVDCIDLHGVTDFAIGHFGAGEDKFRGSCDAIRDEWTDLAGLYGQSRWECLFSEGLIDAEEAEKLADEVWPDEVNKDNEKKAAS